MFELTVKKNNSQPQIWIRMGESEFINIMCEDNYHDDFCQEIMDLPENEQFDVWFDILCNQSESVEMLTEGEPGWIY